MGIVPPLGQQEIAAGSAVPVVYHGGQVMRNVTIHTVFWAPTGYRFTGSPGAGVPGYEAMVQQFLERRRARLGGRRQRVLGAQPVRRRPRAGRLPDRL